MSRLTITKESLPPAILKTWLAMGMDSDDLKFYRAQINGADDGYNVLLGREPVGDEGEDLRWHLSVAHEQFLPEWEHLVEIAHHLRPGVVWVAGIPPKSWWINVHPNCLHLWQVKDENLTNQWQFESRGDTPT